jgi:hypothetical protein
MMKKWMLLMLTVPMVSVAATTKTTVVNKTVEATLVFVNKLPFNSQNEHGGYCAETILDFLYIFTVTEDGQKEFLPVLNGTGYFTNQCADDLNWDLQDQLVASLNAHVTSTHYLQHELKVQATYLLEQEETPEAIVLREKISFYLPELKTPFLTSASKKISKRKALISKSFCDKENNYRVEMSQEGEFRLTRHPLFPSWEVDLLKKSDNFYSGQNGYVFSELWHKGGDVYTLNMGEFTPHGEPSPTESVILNQQNCI